MRFNLRLVRPKSVSKPPRTRRIVYCRLFVEELESRQLLSAITFADVAAEVGAGIDYQRVPSATNVGYEAVKHQPTYTLNDLINNTPDKARGSPGVAIFDFNNDGYPDIFVTNGPGGGCKLYENLRGQTGKLQFKDVSVQAGVACLDMDATGVCYGDINNDGYEDLFVLGRNQPNRLFLNNGNGTFTDITAQAGVGGGTFSHTSCSMGDINGDGLLDIVVGNTYDWTHQPAIFAVPYALNQPNQLYLNLGNGQFKDVSDSSGIRNLAGLPPGAASITWAIAMVDYDQDGKIDIVQADDQGAIPMAKYPGGGPNRGFIHLLHNDGTGHFTDQSGPAGFLDRPGAWMGLSFGDFNSDGRMDIFATNFGDYGFTVLPLPYTRGDLTSRWFLGQSDGTFADPGVGDLKADSFGWGTSTLDYDNNGTTDIAYFGHIDVGTLIVEDNPGALLSNDGTAHFTRDATALGSTNYNRRSIFGEAVGDLNNDGFDDIVTVSAMDIPDSVPLVRFPVSQPPSAYGSPFDSSAYFVPQFTPTGPGTFTWNGFEFPNGTLQVQVNSADNGNGWVKIRTRGSVGLIPGGQVNRDGIGAVVQFTPDHGKEVMKAIVAGASFESADSLSADFGLGKEEKGTVDILWPGGVRNRLYDLHDKESIVFPEIPISYDVQGMSFGDYRQGVARALDQLIQAGSLSQEDRGRFLSSALRAFLESHPAGNGQAAGSNGPPRLAVASPHYKPVGPPLYGAFPPAQAPGGLSDLSAAALLLTTGQNLLPAPSPALPAAATDAPQPHQLAAAADNLFAALAQGESDRDQAPLGRRFGHVAPGRMRLSWNFEPEMRQVLFTLSDGIEPGFLAAR